MSEYCGLVISPLKSIGMDVLLHAIIYVNVITNACRKSNAGQANLCYWRGPR